MRVRRRLLRIAVPDLSRHVEGLAARMDAAHIHQGVLGYATDVVRLIEGEHPEWLGINKKEFCRQAVTRFIERSGGKPKDSLVNVIIELAVNLHKAELGTHPIH